MIDFPLVYYSNHSSTLNDLAVYLRQLLIKMLLCFIQAKPISFFVLSVDEYHFDDFIKISFSGQVDSFFCFDFVYFPNANATSIKTMRWNKSQFKFY